jgi:arylsulfatase A-like enzyme
MKKIIFVVMILIFDCCLIWGISQPKNVIIISVDTLRADHLSCYGYPLNTSKVIDSLAKDGILFTKCYTLTPLTTPSFGTMLTSLPPHKHGAKRNGLAVYKHIKTIPFFLKRYGYRTAAFISNWPLRKKLLKGDTYFDEYHEVFTKKRYLGLLNSEGQAPEVNKKVLRWIKSNHKKLFFLWIQYTEPHRPYILHKNFQFTYSNINLETYPPGTRMSKIKCYDSEIAFTDHYIGKLIRELKSLGLYDETLIIFHADHGESFGEHNYFRHGRHLYNSTIHVPLIIKLPKNRFQGVRFEGNVSILDIAPTILSTMNLKIPPHFEGLTLLRGEHSFVNRAIFLETYKGAVIFRRNNKKFHMNVKPSVFGVVKGASKIIFHPKKKLYKVFNLRDDPFEVQNIYFNYPSTPNLKEILSNNVKHVTKILRLVKAYDLKSNTISKDDLEQLKSLGYYDEK